MIWNVDKPNLVAASIIPLFTSINAFSINFEKNGIAATVYGTINPSVVIDRFPVIKSLNGISQNINM